ncbi:hydrolase [Ampullimonas aquatilis]|uniref:hydrolase n=1 Tax=Ampullimonas aquatilis TaxID=1341549 RepID=UPI003C70B90E
MSEFHGSNWLASAHAQTIYPALLGRSRFPRPTYRRERWSTPDDDFIDVDWLLNNQHIGRAKPLVVMFHGLEGSSQSHYARALMGAVIQLGWRGAVPHFRGCSGEPNQAPRFYHSGDSTEIAWILKKFRAEHAGPLFVVGISLGGNALVRFLGEEGERANLVDAAAIVSAPLDLAAGGKALSQGFNMFYTRMFLRTLKRKCLHKLQHFPDLFDRQIMLQSRDLYEFDNVVTAPLHGYRSTDDYWHRASGKHVLKGITQPTLIINARNDPFLPAQVLPRQADVSAAVTLEQPEQGGHVGFLSGSWPGSIDWLPVRVLKFFKAQRREHG